jgi:hypothetical protein
MTPDDPKSNLNDYLARQRTSARMESHLQRLGAKNPGCCICGYSAPEGLIKASKAVVEQHHLMGRHEGLWVYLCRNHHAELTNAQSDHDPLLLSSARDERTRLAALLRGLADFFEWLAREFRIRAQQIMGWQLEGSGNA